MLIVDIHPFQHVFHKLVNKAGRCVFLEVNTLDHHSYLHMFQFGAGHRCELARVQAELRGWVQDQIWRGTFEVHLQEAFCQVSPGPSGAQAAPPGNRDQQRGAQTQTQR